MTEQQAIIQTSQLVKQNSLRMACLQAVQSLDLPQGMIGAGFLRNLIWDALHHYPCATSLNDVDVVYFDPTDTCRAKENKLAKMLKMKVPEANWEVRNQARMHHRHGHQPYTSVFDGVRRWVELPTCVAVWLQNNELAYYAPYGLQQNWQKTIMINPAFPRAAVFRTRIEQKRWCRQWPALSVIWPEQEC